MHASCFIRLSSVQPKAGIDISSATESGSRRHRAMTGLKNNVLIHKYHVEAGNDATSIGKRSLRRSVRTFASSHGVKSKIERGGDNGVMELVNGRSEAKSWWSPLFDFPKEDYFAVEAPAAAPATGKLEQRIPSEPAEKFKLLRVQLRDLETWHDTMYHSPIASRLAIARDDTPDTF